MYILEHGSRNEGGEAKNPAPLAECLELRHIAMLQNEQS